MPKNQDRPIVSFVFSDFHCGSVVGFLPKNVSIDTYGVIKQNPGQEFLFDTVKESLDRAIHSLPKKARCVVFFNGDMTQGDKRPKELISNRMADQITIAKETMQFILGKIPNVTDVFISKGTGSHTFEEGSSEILLKEFLMSFYKTIKVHLTYHGVVTLGHNGITIDYAHHGAPTGTGISKGNTLRSYLKTEVINLSSGNLLIPDLFLRGHYHSFVKETVDILGHTVTGVNLPSMCLIDDYAIQAVKSPSIISPGFITIASSDSNNLFSINTYISKLDIRTTETI